MNKLPEKKYIDILSNLKERIRQARFKAALTVNTQLLAIYWEIGKTILEQQNTEGWGAKIIDRLSMDLKNEFPDMKGLSVRNLKYMRAFAEAYPGYTIMQGQLAQIESSGSDKSEFGQQLAAQIQMDKNEILIIGQQLAAQLPWGHHQVLLDKVRNLEQRVFYMNKCIENGWSRNIMVQQIENELYKRTGKAITNFKQTLPALQSDLVQQTLKNPYVFDFLSFSEEMKERELEKGLIQHLKKFMLELGKGFAYVGNQKNIVVKGDDFFLDLLFFNYNLNCFVVFELKIGDFEPEFAGKLNFYVNTINEQLKGKEHKPTIGVLLCKTPNETVVKYSLQGIGTPIGVSDYKLSKVLPKQLKGEMPTIEEFEAEIDNEYEELKSPSKKRLDALKEKLSQIKGPEIKITATEQIICEIIDKSILPLFKAIINKLSDFNELFVSNDCEWYTKEGRVTDIKKMEEQWKKEEIMKGNFDFKFNYRLFGFKKAGTETFDAFLNFVFRIDVYWYSLTMAQNINKSFSLKKLYHEQLTQSEIAEMVDFAYNFIMDEIDYGMKRIKPVK